MMRLAYLDCFNGISGDMLVGGLIGAGAPISAVEKAVRGLGLKGVRLSAKPVLRAGFAATKFEVFVKSGGREVEGAGHGLDPHHHGAVHEHEHGHGHAHAHGDERSGAEAPSHAGHEHGHSHAHDHGQGRGDSPESPGRPRIRAGQGSRPSSPHVPARDILARIRRAKLSARVKEQASAIFDRLAKAEAKAHGTSPARVMFHEVGAVDSIVDVVGVAAALDALGIDAVHCSPLPITRGHIHGAHGVIPLPGPATLELLRGVPVASCGLEAELVTPTGAAAAVVLASRFGPCPDMTVERVGCGAGARDFPGRPNILRVLVGAAADPETADAVWVVETNLDDVSGEVVGHVLGRLFRAGALDAWTAPIQMKKSRPGVLLGAVCPPSALAAVEDVLFRETATFGVRRHLAQRSKLERRLVSVRTPHGTVRVKVGRRNGRVVTAAPEYEDCRAAAERGGVPLREVMRAAREAFRDRPAGGNLPKER